VVGDVNRFDWSVLSLMAVLALLTGIVIVRGDRVGVRVVAFSPERGATNVSGRVAVRVTFGQEMEQASVEKRFTFSPPVEGTFRWEGKTLVFRPTQPLACDTDYTLTLRQGARSRQGREISRDVIWRFHTRWLQVLYLTEQAETVDLWVTDSEGQRQTALTAVPVAVWDYAVSPDGGQIVYSAEEESGAVNLWLMDADGQNKVPMTEGEAQCSAAAWSPDGEFVAYERRSLASGRLGDPPGPGTPRVWLLDPQTGETRPLFADDQTLGYAPVWSPDGGKLAFFDPTNGGIAIYDLQSGELSFIPNEMGGVGSWSPDGEIIAYPQFFLQGRQFYSHLVLYTLTDGSTRDLSALARLTPNGEVEDGASIWSPDGRWLAVPRRRLRTDEWVPSFQLWLVRPDGSESRPLTDESDYHHGSAAWSPDGRTLAFVRMNVVQKDARPEIWLIDVDGSNSCRLVEGGFQPAWLP
jgi:TolB protein